MEAVGRLTAGVAHDFNNQLTVIGSNLEMIAGRLPPDQAKLSRHTQAAMQGVRRAALLTGRLLAFSRHPAPEPESVEVDRLIGGLAELLRRTMGNRITMRVSLSNSPWFVWADVNQMENAILSLLVNARDQVPDGGVLDIVVANLTVDDSSAAALSMTGGDYIEIRIGGEIPIGGLPGPRDWQSDLFMTRAFLREAGGRLLNDEATRLLLPRYVPPRRPSLPRPGDGRVRVMVVEDDDDLRRLCVETLRGHGYDVLEAPDAMDACRLIADQGGIDLLFTDLGLPGGVTGRALADAAQNMDAAIRVLFTTGYDRADIPEGSFLLRKPFNEPQLVAAVQAALAGRRDNLQDGDRTHPRSSSVTGSV